MKQLGVGLALARVITEGVMSSCNLASWFSLFGLIASDAQPSITIISCCVWTSSTSDEQVLLLKGAADYETYNSIVHVVVRHC